MTDLGSYTKKNILQVLKIKQVLWYFLEAFTKCLSWILELFIARGEGHSDLNLSMHFVMLIISDSVISPQTETNKILNVY